MERKKLATFDEWCEVESFMDYIEGIKNEAKTHFLAGAPKMDGEVEAYMYVSSHSGDSDMIEDTINVNTLEEFISDALDELEDDILDSFLSTGYLRIAIGTDKNEFDLTDSLYERYESDMLAAGYSFEEIYDINEPSF